MNEWDILGISADATIGEIKKAYAQKVRVYHPEEDPHGFQQIRKAYETAMEQAKARTQINTSKMIEQDKGYTEPVLRNDWENGNHHTLDTTNKIIQDITDLYNDDLKREDVEQWKLILDQEGMVSIDVKSRVYSVITNFVCGNHILTLEVLTLLNEYFGWTEHSEDLIDIIFSEKEILAIYQRSKGLPIKIRSAHILYYDGLYLENQQKYQDAIALYDELINEFTDNEEVALQIAVARAMFHKGYCVGEGLGKYKQGLSLLDELIDKYADSYHIEIMEQLSMGLFFKGYYLSKLGEYKEAIVVQDTLFNKFNGIENPEIEYYVARSLLNKGACLMESGKKREGMRVLNELVYLYEDSADKGLRSLADKAQKNIETVWYQSDVVLSVVIALLVMITFPDLSKWVSFIIYLVVFGVAIAAKIKYKSYKKKSYLRKKSVGMSS